MKIAVLSGKGGAGKTMVAVNLAAAAGKAVYIDCDVEEPNGRLFFRPEALQTEPVTVQIPDFDPARCTGCKTCVKNCRFHALIYIKEKPMLFTEVCHSCGLCALVCPENAIRETEKQVGAMEIGRHGNTTVVTGILTPGEASGIPVIHRAMQQADGLTIIDCPPGSACSVMESAQDADYCVLVAEPTAFGFDNFKMVHELVTLLGKPCGVIINKEETPYPPLEAYCRAQKLPVLMHIPYSREYSAIIARGGILSEERPRIRTMFRELLQKIGGGAA